jgi:hypothetical protein
MKHCQLKKSLDPTAYSYPWYIQYKNAKMSDCLASGQFSTGMKKTNDAGTGPVQDWADKVRHFLVRYRNKIMDAGISFLDADAQLC